MNELASAIAREREKQPPKEGAPGPGPQPPPKPVKRIRVAEVVKTVRIENEGQWNGIRDRLDQTVRRELSSGNSVELS